MIWHLSLKEKAGWPEARINRAFDFLMSTNFSGAKPGEVIEIDGKNLFAQVQEYETAPESDLLFETHDVYADIQYLVSGKEMFGCAPREGLTPCKPYDAANDITFYHNPEACDVFLLNPGDCILVTPNTAHMPRRKAESSTLVKKIVVKVKMT